MKSVTRLVCIIRASSNVFLDGFELLQGLAFKRCLNRFVYF